MRKSPAYGTILKLRVNVQYVVLVIVSVCGVIGHLSSRLPEDVRPIKYSLTMHPDFETDRFSGNVVITISITKPKQNIALHSSNLSIDSTVLWKMVAGAPSPNKRYSLNEVDLKPLIMYPDTDMIVVEPKIKPLRGKFKLRLSFSGSMIGKMHGFYVSQINDSTTGISSKLATTQFEPTHARKAFPCFDEPSFKAEFNVYLVQPSDERYVSLSNMPPISMKKNVPAPGLTTVQFERSVPMSTYLVAFIVSDFVGITTSVQNMEGEDIPITVYTSPFKRHTLPYSLNVASRFLEFYIEIFAVDYPLPKIDMVAIPDFSSGAMENWGLITYRETAMLYEPGASSMTDLRHIASTVAHELAHMWFGNLVTMKWWNDIWLNEGFATYMKYVATDYLYPDWNEMGQFVIEAKYEAMSSDSKISSHPIIQPSETTDQIDQLFDSISYRKGASIIRMVDNFMGTERFFKGITRYLNRNKFGNAITQDLLLELQTQMERKGIDLVDMVYTWLDQSGFPVVNVVRKGNKFILKQTRFLSDSDAEYDVDDSPYKYKWDIPISYITSESNETGTLFFPRSNKRLVVDDWRDAQWVKINDRSVGYFRVNYDMESWMIFSRILATNRENLSEDNRADLLSDAFTMADAGLLSYGVSLNLLRYIKKEKGPLPWMVAASKLRKIRRFLHDTPAAPSFDKFVSQLVAPIYEKIGWETYSDEPYRRKRLRVTITNLACTVENEDCTTEVGTQFLDWLEGSGEKPDPDMRGVIYNQGMSSIGNKEHWNKMFELYLKENDPQEKAKFLRGLTSIKDSRILKKFIQLAEDENIVRRQNYFTVLSHVASNEMGTQIVWDYLRSHWDYLIERFTIKDRTFGRIISDATASFNTRAKLREVQTFFAKYPKAGAGSNSRRQALETIKSNIAWANRNIPAITKWLQEN